MSQIFDVFSSSFGSDASNGGPEIPTVSLRRAGEEDGSDQDEADIWSDYGFAYRPAAPDAKGATQVVADFVAGRWSVIASRDTRGADIYGALNEGDVAVWSIGKNAVRLNADGSISLFKQGATVDSAVAIGDDGAITLLNEWGVVQLGSDGFSVTLASGQMLSLGPDGFNVSAPSAGLSVGAFSFGAGASTPLAVTPCPTGGFVVSKPLTWLV